MCGIAGVMARSGSDLDLHGIAEAMASRMPHRGPDDAGTWLSPGGHAALGFRRLAIIDLSEAGHQPMSSASGRYTIVFNGEIYNHAGLRDELVGCGHRFRGHSDTEVILAAVEQWGLERAIGRMIGMFAIALWDEETRALSLTRDRLGIKPLFVFERGGLVAFASELKALVGVPGFDGEVDPDSVAEFLRYLYVPAPHTIYRRVRKLLPGHVLTIRDPANVPDPAPYWDVRAHMEAGLADPFVGSEEEAVAAMQDLVDAAVMPRLYADVPLGAFLSGGIDSTTVVAAMQRGSNRPVRTFSIAFDVHKYNEADDAARIARYLGTDHTEIMLTGQEALDVVPLLPTIFDEPHADTSQIPAYLLCKKARNEVTVALSGDGGDEVFGGYNRYSYGERLIGRLGRVPTPLRRVASGALTWLSPHLVDGVFDTLSPLLPKRVRLKHAGDKAHKIGRTLAQEGEAGMYRSLVSAWPDPERFVSGAGGRSDPLAQVFALYRQRGLIDRMMLADQLTYLPDDQLAKVDRVSMAVSLEVRVPLVDHRLVEFAWRLPTHLKTRGGEGKWLLRQALYRQVPRELVDRPKMGLSVPLGEWLRGPLREWAEELLASDALRRDGLLDPGPIRREWADLQGGRDEAALGIWSAIMLQAWRAKWS